MPDFGLELRLTHDQANTQLSAAAQTQVLSLLRRLGALGEQFARDGGYGTAVVRPAVFDFVVIGF